MYEELKQALLEHPDVFTKNKKINPNLFRHNFVKTQLWQDICLALGDLNLGNVEAIYYIIHYNENISKCVVCGSKTSFMNFVTGYRLHCSKKCSVISEAKTRKNNCQEKYGVSSYVLTSEFKAKTKETNMAKYNVPYYLYSNESKEQYRTWLMNRTTDERTITNQKRKSTCLEKYGVESYSQSPMFLEQIRRTSMIKNGVDHQSKLHYANNTKRILFNKLEFVKFAFGKSVSYISQELGIDGTTTRTYIIKYKCEDIISSSKSKYENIIKEYLDSLKITYINNTRKIIPPLELDFYLPEYNIAIEINGNYWHSEIAGHKDRYYHINKWKKCREQDITLYSYFEDELVNSLSVIKAKLRYLTNQNNCVIGARKCTIQDISFKEESTFLDKYHIQGASRARSKCIGAYYCGDLVAVFAWALKKNYLEITRYACKTNASYPGLFSKMMKHMIKELNYTGEIVSFSNNGHSNGNVYKQSGFTNVKELGPAYWYMKDYLNRENRQNYMKNKIRDRFSIPQEEIDTKTEWQLMQELGYDRIFDSGKIKWSKYGF